MIVAVATLVLVTLFTSTVATATTGAKKSREFSEPAAIVFARSRAWVANYGGNSITELNSSDGALVRVINKASYRFNRPVALAIGGNDLWVANSHGNSVTELNTENRSLVRVVSDPKDMINDPNDIDVIGSDVWILDTGDGDITELRASDGVLVRVITGLSQPLSFDVIGGDAWVTGSTQTLEEFNVITGAEVINSRLSDFQGGGTYLAADVHDLWLVSATDVLMQFSLPNLVQLHSFYSESEGSGPISLSRGELWSATNNEVTQYNATTGNLGRVVKIPAVSKYGAPDCIVASGEYVWVCYQHSLRELNAYQWLVGKGDPEEEALNSRFFHEVRNR